MLLLDDAKARLRVTDADSDALIQSLIDAALIECQQFTGLAPADPVMTSPPDDLLAGVYLMVEAGYDGDPKDRGRYRSAAETLWQPYRIDQGV